MKLDIKSLAMGVIEEYGTNDPFEIAEMLDIQILFHELPTELNAYRLDNIIVLNSILSVNNRKWVLAHELGHFFIHGPEYTLGNYVKNPLLIRAQCEKQADKFASELLLNDIDKFTLEGLTLEQIACLYSVPERYIQYKLCNEVIR